MRSTCPPEAAVSSPPPSLLCCMDLALWVMTSCRPTFRCWDVGLFLLGSGTCKSPQASAWALTQSGPWSQLQEEGRGGAETKLFPGDFPDAAWTLKTSRTAWMMQRP